MDDDDPAFTEAGLRGLRDITAALNAIVENHQPAHWYAALAVYVGTSIRDARRNLDMPLEKAQMLVDEIRNGALEDGPVMYNG